MILTINLYGSKLNGTKISDFAFIIIKDFIRNNRLCFYKGDNFGIAVSKNELLIISNFLPLGLTNK